MELVAYVSNAILSTVNRHQINRTTKAQNNASLDLIDSSCDKVQVENGTMLA
jgi:hypothetical protein